jgi:hypothetical protein
MFKVARNPVSNRHVVVVEDRHATVNTVTVM